MKRIIYSCAVIATLMLMAWPVHARTCIAWEIWPPYGCIAHCGGEGDIACVPPFGTGCDSGLSVRADLLCHAECGGHGEAACLPMNCDAGHTLDPTWPAHCTGCGGEGQFVCLNIVTNEYYCDAWHTLDPDITDDWSNMFGKCTACGGSGQMPCIPPNPGTCGDDLAFFIDGVCEPCGGSFGPACSSEPACDPFNTPVSDYYDPLDFTDLIDVWDLIPDVCLPCGGTWEPECLSGAPCEPWHNPAVICTPCGGQAQPLCWSGSQCKPDYEVEGWQFPLCYSKPAAGPEPETGYSGTVPQQAPGEPLWGWVDTHEHQFANLAYGGVTYWGKVFDEDAGVSAALAECDYTTAEEFDEVVLPTLWDGFDNPPEIMSEWLGELAGYFAGQGLDWLGNQLNWLANTITDPLGPVADWLDGLVNQLPGGHWLVSWLPGAIDSLIEELEPVIGPAADLLEPAFVQGLYMDLAPLEPPYFDVVPRYGIHGDDPVNQPTSPSQFWLGLTGNIPVTGGPQNFHRVGGYPNFEGWPAWNNGGHQQMYYKWLERAYQGGMRLLVNLPVNNEVLCEMSFQRADFQEEEGANCDDMPTVDRQIDRIYELQKFIDLQCGDGTDECGWYRVVTDAGQARSVIEQGKMAVIIGIEVDTLFGCKPDSNYCCEYDVQDCLDQGYTSYEDFIDKKVQEYYDKGVRYIFPVHFWNNKFTGGAPYRDYFVYSQVLANGSCFELYECSDLGYGYSIGGEVPELDFIFASLTDKLGMPECTEYNDYEAVCNKKGLTEEGIILMNELIERDMLIDQDHLPLHATSGYSYVEAGVEQHWPGLLDIAEDWDEGRGYKYPIVSSHSSIAPDYDRGSEGGTFWSEAVRIRNLGGVISVPQARDECSNARNFIGGKSEIEDEFKFQLELSHMADLEANEFTQSLWNAFAANDYIFTMPYTNVVDVETIESDTEWRISDYGPQNGWRFRVKKVDDNLDVHLESYRLGYLAHAEFMSRGLPEGHQAYPRIGLRSDFGAFLAQAGPRFRCDNGQEDCDAYVPICGDQDEGTELAYPFDAFDDSGTFDKQVTGNRTFDLNTQGLAHVGLWVDFLADARAISESDPGVPDVDFDPIFHSAEAYIRMWEWIENCTPDTVLPDISCPPTIITYAKPEGTMVTYDPPPTAEDFCDWIPPDVTTVATDTPSGSVFLPGVNTVTATATDSSENTSQCQFDVNVSCFSVNDVKVFDDKNEIEVKGSFKPALPVDPTAVEVYFEIDDGHGHDFDFTIPAGSFEVVGGPANQKFRFDSPKGAMPDIAAKFDFLNCTFELKIKMLASASNIDGSGLVITLQTGQGDEANVGQDMVALEAKEDHREYKARPKVECCP